MSSEPMVEVAVARLGIDGSSGAFVVVLREKGGDRILPIWIGRVEAESIVMHMNRVKSERPRTHDLCASLLTALDGILLQVTITRVESNTYYAEMNIEGRNGITRVDCRPSDGIAVALRLNAPVLAADSLLTEADDAYLATSDEPDEEIAPEQGSAEMSAEALKAYLERLRPEDFGKFRP